jgi:hypothetical protein
MARVLRDFPVPEDPLKPKGSLRRAWWRTIKESFALARFRINPKPLILGGLGLMIYHWGLPHVLFNYRYVGDGAYRIYQRCEYLGWQPFIAAGPSCPVVVWVPWDKLGR